MRADKNSHWNLQQKIPIPSLRFPFFILLIMAPLIALQDSAVNYGPFSLNNFNTWFFIHCVVTVFIFTCVGVFLKLKQQRTITIIEVSLVGMILAFFKGVFTASLGSMFFEEVSWDLDLIVGRGIGVAGIGATFAFSYASWSAYSEGIKPASEKLIREKQRLFTEIRSTDQEIEKLQSEDRVTLLNTIVESLVHLGEIQSLVKNSEQNWRTISEQLRSRVAESVRHQSTILSRFETPKENPLTIWFFVNKIPRIHVGIFIILQFLMALGNSEYYSRANLRGFLALGVHALISFLVLRVSSHFLSHFTGRESNFNVIIFLIIPTILSFLYAVVDEWLFGIFNLKVAILAYFFQVLLLTFISTTSLFLQIKQEDLSLKDHINLDLLNKQKVLERHHKKLRDDLAKYLHGYLISKIYTVAEELDNLAKANRFTDYQTLLHSLFTDLTLASFHQDTVHREIDSKFFEGLQVQWEGMMEIRIDGEEELNGLSHRIQRVEIADVCIELVNNAYRHGGASRIEITFEEGSDRKIHLSAVDNGVGPAKDFIGGLGSNLYDLASDQNWSIQRTRSQETKVSLSLRDYADESRLDHSAV